jgi:flagellar FliL protein
MAKVVDKAEGGGQAAAPAASPSIMSLIIVMMVLTGLSLGAGGLFGLMVLSKPPSPAPAAKAAATPVEARKTRYSEKVAVYALPPIVTNLASPERAWIRIEASLVSEEEGSEAKANAAKVAEDAIAYLRTLSLPMIEGASGLLHLREDLLERARLRTNGKAQDLIVHTLIIE